MKIWIIIGVVAVIAGLGWASKELHASLVETKLELAGQKEAFGKLTEGIAEMEKQSKEHQLAAQNLTRKFNALDKEVRKYAQDTTITRVHLPAQWVWLHDVHARGLDPSSSAARDLQALARPADDIEVIEAVRGNYKAYDDIVLQLQTCQKYVQGLGRF